MYMDIRIAWIPACLVVSLIESGKETANFFFTTVDLFIDLFVGIWQIESLYSLLIAQYSDIVD